MSNLWHLWNPFSKKAKHTKADAEEDRSLARKIHKDAAQKKEISQRILEEQKKLSEQLRKEQRRNHFGDMFQTAVPIRTPYSKGND